MQFEEYEIINITPEIHNVYVVRLKPKDKKNVSVFKPGQFFHIKNPTYHKPDETRQFSAITLPTDEYIEFCVKIYGLWTETFIRKSMGESVWLFGPMGVFTIQNNVSPLVFIAGGVGITPIFSILQSISERNRTAVTLLYANRSADVIVKKREIDLLFLRNPSWQLVSILSQPNPSYQWNGCTGHITQDFLSKEVSMNATSMFYVCGSPQFTKQIIELLLMCHIAAPQIKQEIFLGRPPTTF